MAELLAARQTHYKALYAKIVAHIYKDSKVTDYGVSDIDEIYNNLYQFLCDNEKAVISYGFMQPEARLFHSKDVDKMAQMLLPEECNGLFPILTKADGNCLYNAISLYYTGIYEFARELRIKVVNEIIKNRSEYDIPLHSNYADVTSGTFKEDVVNSIKSGTYSSLRYVAALSRVLGCKINSVYLEVINSCVNRKDLHRVFATKTIEIKNYPTTISVLWSHAANSNLRNWSPNHFVLLVNKNDLFSTPITQPSQLTTVKNDTG